MRGRFSLWCALLVVALTAVPAAAQTQTGSVESWSAPRTSWGDPDLQGIWSFATITPLERPSRFAGRDVLTEEEVAAANADSETRASSDRRSQLTPETDVALAYNQFLVGSRAVDRTDLAHRRSA